MKKIVFGCLVSVLLTGCTSPTYNYVPKTEFVSKPSVGSVNTAFVGDELVRQGTVSQYEGIKVTALAKIGMAYSIMPGFLAKRGEDENSEFYLPTGGADSAIIDKSFLADPWQAVMVKKDTKTLCVITAFNISTCADNMPFEKISLSVSSDSSFQQTLLYNGRVGNKINIGYRELSNNMARPAFNNDVEYDLSASRLIGYKGARLEVIEATNQSITYKLLGNFN
ncbi:hypothetical protein SOASR030_21230 [Leminorella grimontii]|uniref:Lipoprotein n=1 Tax=Leminorella grimontii TaxID=82981 RepID=A0AAV5N5I5_9GAMM|nr:hypothetical protein [Leminorella grimontii]KFC96864.1 hypothetical protein GLGR_0863 [Leminorella grimontii ATCC 33999 = DSM 5078]GKX56011.1 hypothetical protein SOASR030_21230 [Leminorella grimontii]VFS57683.1 Uncharacterised protein [Leminorella grimontii]